jgi:hypothetical protein
MRIDRVIPGLALVAFLSVGACTGDRAPGSAAQGGDPDGRGAGQTPARGGASVARDTTPHRPMRTDTTDTSEITRP